MADDDLLSNVRGYVSTQSIALNKAIGHPGFPRGRLIEISGMEHTGKSTLLDHVFAETQRVGGVGILVDPEIGRDAKYSRSIGVNAEKLLCPQPKEGKFYALEDVFNFVGKAADWWKKHHPGTPVTIGVDSIAGMPTREDLKREAGEQKPGDAARAIRHSLRNIMQRIAMSEVCLVFVNQLYTRIGHMGYGDPRIEYGGGGIPYHASLRIRLKTGEAIKNKDGVVIGSVIIGLIKKSKVSAVSGNKVEFAIRHGIGIDNVWTLFERFKRDQYIAQPQGSSWCSMMLPAEEGKEPEAFKWQGGHLGLEALCHENEGLYNQLVAIYGTMPG